MSDLDPFSPELDLDEGRARRRQALRRRSFQCLQVPALRLLGLVFLCLLVLLHNRYVTTTLSPGQLNTLSQFLIGYGALSWLAIVSLYNRFDEVGLVFLCLDLPVWCVAIVATGADQSWLFFLLLARVGDQANTHFRRVFLFLCWTVLCYFVALQVAFRLGHPIDWPAGLTKLTCLFLGGLYLSFTAYTAERLRDRTRQAIDKARSLIGELEAEKQRSQLASRSKSRFLGLISHELRTPLNPILGFAQMLSEGVAGPLNDKQKRYANSIQKGGRRLLKLVDEVLSFSEADSDSLELEVSQVCLDQVVRSAVNGISEREFCLSLPQVTPLMGDFKRLERIVEILLERAVELATEPAQLSVTLQETGRAIRLTLHDPGTILTASQVQQMMAPFEREQNGSGLGLRFPMASLLAQAHGGWVSVRSDERGTNYELCLPREEPD